MDKPLPFLAKPRSQHIYEKFPRCTANSIFPVEAIRLEEGQVLVKLRTAPRSFLWLALQDVQLIDPALELSVS